MTKKNDLAIALIKEKTDPKTGACTLSKKKLGEILFKRYPSEFTSSHTARTVIGRATGVSQTRGKYKNQIKWKGLSLPEPEKNDYSKFILNDQRVGVLSDIHFPYYDKEALNAAISYLKKWKPDCILLNGDILDCYQLSSFEKDPRNRSFKYEVDMLRNFIIELRRIFPKARIVFKLGNHSERYEKKILQRLPEFLDLELFKFENVISARELGIEVVDNKRIIKAGKLNIIHGHELAKGFVMPVNPARGFFLRTKANVLGGHHHKSSEHYEQDLNGEVIGAWSTGCLCELHPRYMPVNGWNHGFATVENFGSDFTVKNLKIIHGKVL